MKKKFLNLFLILLLFLPCLCVMNGCGEKKFTLSVNLNDNSASYTDKYKEDNGYSGRNLAFIVNEDLYDNFSKRIPTLLYKVL